MKPSYKPKKRLGQNFLVDNHIIEKIIIASQIKSKDNIIEIGPGLGALTRHLTEINDSLRVIEIDTSIISHLQKACPKLKHENIICKNFLNVDLKNFYSNQKIKILGNLPYNVASLILIHLIKFKKIISEIYVMLQKEVAERIISKPDSKIYGRLSVILQYHFGCTSLFSVTSDSFKPKPKVESQVIKLVPYKVLPFKTNNYPLFLKIVKETFGQRRKQIRNTLKKFNFKNKNIPIDLTCRPENLSIQDFVLLTNYMSD